MAPADPSTDDVTIRETTRMDGTVLEATKESPSPPAGDLITSTPQPDQGELLFERYRLERELGRGGMGSVLLAHDTVLEVNVALKLIPNEMVRDAEGIGDLKKEVLRGMELTHPNIVRVFSFEQRAGRAAIVMEYVAGETLAQKKAQQVQRCFGCEEVLPWLTQLCAALDYAHHEARIAHRDLKPGNLMLSATGRLKVADFGIASSLSETASRVSVRRNSAGTPPYMSPQQIMGDRPTHLDDIYSLGATFYELLTGKPPFYRGNILAQVLHEEPVSMVERRAELGVSLAPPIPVAWETMIAACLAKSPEVRPQRAAELLKMLTEPVRTLAVSRWETVPEQGLKLVAVETTQHVHPRPVPPPAVPRSTVETVYVPARRSLDLQPVVSAFSAIIHGLLAGLAAILQPLLKLAVLGAALWVLLHLKNKYDEGRAGREAAEARRVEEVQQGPSANPQPTNLQPASAPPQRPEQGQPGPLDRPPPPPMGPRGSRPPPRR